MVGNKDCACGEIMKLINTNDYVKVRMKDRTVILIKQVHAPGSS